VFEKTPESGGKPFRYEGRNSGDGLFQAIREFQRIFEVFGSIAMIQKRKSSLLLDMRIRMLRTLASQYHYVADAKLTWLEDVTWLVLDNCRNLCINKHLRLDCINPMTLDWTAFCSQRRSFHYALTISIRYFPEGILVIANRNTEKIPVSVVFSPQHVGEEMPVPVNSTSALNHWGCYFCVRTEIGSGSSVADLPSINGLAKQALSVMRRVSFSPAGIRTANQAYGTGKRAPELLRGSVPVKNKPGYSSFRSG
jgi:hypothetical protein